VTNALNGDHHDPPYLGLLVHLLGPRTREYFPQNSHKLKGEVKIIRHRRPGIYGKREDKYISIDIRTDEKWQEHVERKPREHEQYPDI
jgi:hypothetical protein